MKARVKATGEIVDVDFIACRALTNRIVNVYEEINKETGARIFTSDELDFNNSIQIDWEQRRYELIKEAMGANIAVIGINCFNENVIISTSIDIADAIIKKLKESEEIK